MKGIKIDIENVLRKLHLTWSVFCDVFFIVFYVGHFVSQCIEGKKMQGVNWLETDMLKTGVNTA